MATIAASTTTALVQPPSRTSRPLIGLWPEMRSDTLGLLTDVATRGDVAGFRLGTKPAVVISAPEPIRDILITHPEDFEKGKFLLRVLRPVLGDGLLVSEGQLHSRQRRLIAPTLGARRIRRYVDWMVEEADTVIGSWRHDAEIDVLGEINTLAMNIIGRILFGAPLRDEHRLADAVTAVFEWEMKALTRPIPLPATLPLPGNRRMRAARQLVRERIGTLIQDRSDAGDSLLDRLAAATDDTGATMPADQLLNEVLTLWGAAHETSADAQAWTVYLLARHPQVLNAVTAEVDQVLGRRAATFDDLSRLPLCLQVFKESLRLYPPAAAMVRVARRDTTAGRYRIRAGTIVFICPYTLHRNPRVYDKPEEFQPDRFAADQEKHLPKQAFLPFGAGAHGCIGNHLALMEGHLVTAVLAQRVRFQLPIDQTIRPELLINLRPAQPLTAKVTHRNPPN